VYGIRHTLRLWYQTLHTHTASMVSDVTNTHCVYGIRRYNYTHTCDHVPTLHTHTHTHTHTPVITTQLYTHTHTYTHLSSRPNCTHTHPSLGPTLVIYRITPSLFTIPHTSLS